MGTLRAIAEGSATCPAVRSGIMGAELDPPACRTARMAVAVRAGLARQEVNPILVARCLHIASTVQHEDLVSAERARQRSRASGANGQASVNAVAIRQLAEASRCIDNAALLETLPLHEITMAQILENLDQSRSA